MASPPPQARRKSLPSFSQGETEPPSPASRSSCLNCPRPEPTRIFVGIDQSGALAVAIDTLHVGICEEGGGRARMRPWTNQHGVPVGLERQGVPHPPARGLQRQIKANQLFSMSKSGLSDVCGRQTEISLIRPLRVQRRARGVEWES